MKLKRSMYNLEVEKLENDNVLLFNSYTSALGLMDNKTQEIYYNIESIDDWTNSVDEETKNNIQIMIDNGFLIDNTLDEVAAIEVYQNMQKYNSNVLNLVIAPTLNCNMNCPYCYENKSNKRFDDKTKKALVQFAEKYIKQHSIKHLSVTWYGGEPLLEKNTIKELTDLFRVVCADENVQYSACIVTNGSLLDYETGKLLKECGVTHAQITVDGMEETNNKRRILNNGKNSFKLITNNIKECQDLFNIAIRVNVDKTNSDEVTRLYDFFTNENRYNKNVSIYFAPVEKISESCVTNSHDCLSNKEFGEMEIELIRRIENKMSGESSQYPYSKILPCGAVAMNNYIVDPDGDLYKCWEEIGVKEKSVGSVFTDLSLNGRAIDWLSLKLPDECTKCNMRPICQSGCALRRIDGKNSPNCHHTTVSYKEILKKYYEDFMSQYQEA